MEKAGTERAKPSGKKKAPEKEEKSQAERFMETARRVGADESGSSFYKALDMILPKRPSK